MARAYIALILAASMVLAAACRPGGEGSVEEASSSGAAPIGPGFTDVTLEAGLGAFRHQTGAVGRMWFPESLGSGCGFIDANGDGRQDILLIGGGTWDRSSSTPAVRLYRNDGDGTFTDVTEEAGLSRTDVYGFGVAVADYDNDGDDDFYVTTLRENILFRNDAGVFSEVEAGVAGEAVWSTAAIFFDADADGHVDLYVGNYVHWSPESDIFCSLDGRSKNYCTPETYTGIPGRYYRNDGDGTFTDRTEAAGFAPARGKTLGVTELDYNRDGFPDLMVANDTEPDLLYENQGDGTFVERGAIGGVAYDENGMARAGMGIDAGVVDETAEPSLFVGNFSREMIGVYRHAGGGLFLDRASVSRIGRPSLMTLTFGLFLFDYNLDGWLDLFAANGHVQPEIESFEEAVRYAETPHLFVNSGDGRFLDAAPDIGGVLAEPLVARGAAYGDIDEDGDLDVLLVENGGRAHLWRNEADRGSTNYLRVSLVGGESNRSGLSSRVVAIAGDLRMERRVRSGSSYLSASERPVTFGLGERSLVDTLIVEWSGGEINRFDRVAANRHVLITEGSARVDSIDEVERNHRREVVSR